MIDKVRHVGQPVHQQRHVDHDNLEPEEEILPEKAFVDHVSQVPIGCSNNPAA